MQQFIDYNGLSKLCQLIKQSLTSKADRATTLEEYGITNAYTKDEIDAIINKMLESEEAHFPKAEANEF